MNILILGSSGFVGQNICNVLEKHEVSFVGTSRNTGLNLTDFGQTMEFFSDIRPNYIINCAAHVGSLNYVTEIAADVVTDNMLMILSMYNAVSRACPDTTIINPIANCAYPAKSDTFIEDQWWDGHLHRSVLSYGGSKRFLWVVGESFQMQHDIRSIYLFVPNMFGPFDSTDPNKAHALNALISKFVKAEREKQEELVIWGTGVAIREWLYASDFGRIILEILKFPDKIGLDEPLNIAQNFGLSVRELVTLITKHFNYKGKIRWDHNMPDGAPKKVMDDRRFRKIFPNFNFTHLNTGIKETIKYYESIYPY